jgi:hypothetical protein
MSNGPFPPVRTDLETDRVGTKYFANHDYRLLLDVIIVVVANFFRLNDNRYSAIIMPYFV